MTTLVLTVAVVTVAILLACGAVLGVARLQRPAVRRRVLVSLVDGKAMTGVLWSQRGRWLVLRQAELLERGSEAVSLDGEVLIDRAQVDFLQALGA